jgi:hypothetical protein
MTLREPSLGELVFADESGYVLTNFEIGWPTERPVVRGRALNDGLFDNTRYLGGRAITLSLRLDQRKQTMQTLYDRVAQFMSPRLRPTLEWALPGSPNDLRSLTVRGVNMPLPVNGPKYQTIVAQWLSPDSFTKAPIEQCVTSFPGGAEDGRTYNLTFDRNYPATLPTGAKYAVNGGTAPTPWTSTIFGAITDPTMTVNGIDISFTGLTLTAGQTVVINAEQRTVLLNGDPTESRYNLTNYADWTWDQVLLQPGSNIVRLTGTAPSAASMTVCWYDRWL